MLYRSEANNSEDLNFSDPWLFFEELLKLCAYTGKKP